MASSFPAPCNPTQQLCAHLARGILRAAITVPGGELAILGADDDFRPLFERLCALYDDFRALEHTIGCRTGQVVAR